MRRSFELSDNNSYTVKGTIEAEVEFLRKDVSRSMAKFKSLESIHSATTQQLDERREEVYESENCLKFYDRELNSLENIFAREKIIKDNLKAENHGLLALLNVAKSIKERDDAERFTINLWDRIDEEIANELPTGIEIYSNITKRPISKEKIGKYKTETARTSSVYFNLTN